MKTTIIYLTGFMGSGKSTIGPILANTLGWDFVDLDKLIEQKAEKSIKKIFEDQGELWFRQLERNLLKEISGKENQIVSLGGGTIADDENLKILKATGKIVYLKVSNESLFERLRFKRDRPLFLKENGISLSDKEMKEKIENLMKQRYSYYEQADLIINAEHSGIGKTVDKIAHLI
jgi:shikimate kinase